MADFKDKLPKTVNPPVVKGKDLTKDQKDAKPKASDIKKIPGDSKIIGS